MRSSRKRLLVLGWHNIAATPGFPASPEAAERGFAQQMKALARAANVVSLEDGLARMYAGEALPSRAVAITFDDGYRDNLTLGAPVLERLGLPATFFLVPKLLSGEVEAWWETVGWALSATTQTTLRWDDLSLALDSAAARRDAKSQVTRRLTRLNERDRAGAMRTLLDALAPGGEPPRLFMDWEEAGELVKRGFSVQSHTVSHPVLARESVEVQQTELANSRTQLESTLGISISTIAYPHGGPEHYSPDTVAAAEAAGYSWGITTREGFTTRSTPRLEVQRCVVYPERGIIDLLAQLRYIMQRRVSGAQT
jgi:peptidoglycan/xylan/chitin deacetylase (PgdA/CDA1 family)